MPGLPKIKINSVFEVVLLCLGILLLVLSAFYVSSFIAILGTALIFWSALLLYITPSKHVPLTLLTASVESNASNIERILEEKKISEKGIYLPPKRLEDFESSLIFIPSTSSIVLPTQQETKNPILTSESNGLFLTPPGFYLCKYCEQQIGSSFTKTGLSSIQKQLPELFVHTLEIAEKMEITFENDLVYFQITGSVFDPVCQQTSDYPKTHSQVGCLLSSTIACILAKVSGKPVIIKNETCDDKQNTTQIAYQLLEE
jgi:hypothetical protein